jgi:hypothetical protein
MTGDERAKRDDADEEKHQTNDFSTMAQNNTVRTFASFKLIIPLCIGSFERKKRSFNSSQSQLIAAGVCVGQSCGFLGPSLQSLLEDPPFPAGTNEDTLSLVKL